MPLYQYLCMDCGHQSDYLLRFGEVPSGCKSCNGADLQKVIHGQIFGIGGSSKSSSENVPRNARAGRTSEVVLEGKLEAVIVRTRGGILN